MKSRYSAQNLLLIFVAAVIRHLKRVSCELKYMNVNQFHATEFFLYLLETPENLWLLDFFRGYRNRPYLYHSFLNFCLSK